MSDNPQKQPDDVNVKITVSQLDKRLQESERKVEMYKYKYNCQEMKIQMMEKNIPQKCSWLTGKTDQEEYKKKLEARMELIKMEEEKKECMKEAFEVIQSLVTDIDLFKNLFQKFTDNHVENQKQLKDMALKNERLMNKVAILEQKKWEDQARKIESIKNFGGLDERDGKENSENHQPQGRKLMDQSAARIENMRKMMALNEQRNASIKKELMTKVEQLKRNEPRMPNPIKLDEAMVSREQQRFTPSEKEIVEDLKKQRERKIEKEMKLLKEQTTQKREELFKNYLRMSDQVRYEEMEKILALDEQRFAASQKESMDYLKLKTQQQDIIDQALTAEAVRLMDEQAIQVESMRKMMALKKQRDASKEKESMKQNNPFKIECGGFQLKTLTETMKAVEEKAIRAEIMQKEMAANSEKDAMKAEQLKKSVENLKQKRMAETKKMIDDETIRAENMETLITLMEQCAVSMENNSMVNQLASRKPQAASASSEEELMVNKRNEHEVFKRLMVTPNQRSATSSETDSMHNSWEMIPAENDQENTQPKKPAKTPAELNETLKRLGARNNSLMSVATRMLQNDQILGNKPQVPGKPQQPQQLRDRSTQANYYPNDGTQNLKYDLDKVGYTGEFEFEKPPVILQPFKSDRKQSMDGNLDPNEFGQRRTSVGSQGDYEVNVLRTATNRPQCPQPVLLHLRNEPVAGRSDGRPSQLYPDNPGRLRHYGCDEQEEPSRDRLEDRVELFAKYQAFEDQRK